MKHKIHNVLVPIDFSVHAAKTLRAAASFCVRNDARLTLLYVMKASGFLFPENRLTPSLLPELVDVADASLRKQANAVARAYGLSVSSHVVCGDVTEEVLRFVDAGDMDVVIPGIDGDRTTFTQSPASIARRIAVRATCPVLSLAGIQKQGPVSGTAGLVRAKIRLFEDGTI